MTDTAGKQTDSELDEILGDVWESGHLEPGEAITHPKRFEDYKTETIAQAKLALSRREARILERIRSKAVSYMDGTTAIDVAIIEAELAKLKAQEEQHDQD